MGEPHDRVGETPVVNRAVLDALWSAGLTPVVNPVALDKNAEPLNCNADAVAGALAAELRADVLVLLSDIDQLRADVEDPATTMSSVTGDEIDAMRRSGAARDGMTPKLSAARDALEWRRRADPPGERHAFARAARRAGAFDSHDGGRCDDAPLHDDRAAEPE